MKKIKLQNIFFVTALVLSSFSCTNDKKPIHEVPEAKDFWELFVVSYESGDKEMLLNCFSQPHSELIQAYAESESVKALFIKKMISRFGREGILSFNDHDVVGGSVLIWPSIFSEMSPLVIQRSGRKVILDDGYGWRITITKDSDGQYRISNADESFGGHDINRLKRETVSYRLGLKELSVESTRFEDISSLRSKIFDKIN